MADCSQRGAYPDLMKKFNITGYPTVVFTDPKGKEVARLAGRDAASVKSQIEGVIKEHSAPLFLDLSLPEARKAAAEQGKLLAVMWSADKGKDGAKCQAMQAALMADSLEAVRKQILWIKRPLKDGKKKTEEASSFGASKAPTLMILDPKVEEPKESILKKMTTTKGIKKDLEKLLKKAQQG